MPQTFESWIAKLFVMTDEAWSRHANPWSVWTRFTVLPVLVLAIWSRTWIGEWAWVPTLFAFGWMWLNPRLFPAPDSTDNWASKAVLGERVWINRKAVAVPRIHRIAPTLLSGVAALGLPFVVWGLVSVSPWPLLFGMLLIYSGKLWFLDRMVWLYEDMKGANEQYASWLYDKRSPPAKVD